jgi:hypothetical protein
VKSLRLAPILAAFALISHGTLFCEDPMAWLNTLRRTANAPAVRGDPLLSATAARYAERLVERGIITHKGDDGSTGLDRYRAMGGTEVRIGEILGAGPADGLIEEAWMASPDHRAVALSPQWTHAGWGSASAGKSLVMVMMFTCKLVEGLSYGGDGSAFSAAGRFLPVQAAAGVLLNGLEEVAPSQWDPASRMFRFDVPTSRLEGYLRLGYRTAEGAFVLTNAITLPPRTVR